MCSSILARIPCFRQRIIPEPRVPSRGSQARGTRLANLQRTYKYLLYMLLYMAEFLYLFLVSSGRQSGSSLLRSEVLMVVIMTYCVAPDRMKC